MPLANIATRGQGLQYADYALVEILIDRLVQASMQMAWIGFLALTSMRSFQCSSWPAQLFDTVLGKEDKLCASSVQTQTAQRLLQAGLS